MPVMVQEVVFTQGDEGNTLILISPMNHSGGGGEGADVEAPARPDDTQKDENRPFFTDQII